jgi:hypothetical protein
VGLPCRFIQVGNEFNGLFTEAKEKPTELLDVPLEIFGKPKVLDPSRGPTASLLIETLGLRRRRLLRTQEEKGRAWLQGSYLAVCSFSRTQFIYLLVLWFPVHCTYFLCTGLQTMVC